jgi:capsule polysaccharide export protein KpsE/RkpR
MPNPRITFRCPEPIYSQLPQNEKERSQLLLNLLESHYNPTKPEDRITMLTARVEALEKRLSQQPDRIP